MVKFRPCYAALVAGILLVTNSGGSEAHAGRPKAHKYRHSDIDIPISLSTGTVRTAEFPVVDDAYDIMLQAERRLPLSDLQCMMGIRDSGRAFEDCKQRPLIQADWTVSDDGAIVYHGTTSGFDWGQF